MVSSRLVGPSGRIGGTSWPIGRGAVSLAFLGAIRLWDTLGLFPGCLFGGLMRFFICGILGVLLLPLLGTVRISWSTLMVGLPPVGFFWWCPNLSCGLLLTSQPVGWLGCIALTSLGGWIVGCGLVIFSVG